MILANERETDQVPNTKNSETLTNRSRIRQPLLGPSRAGVP